MSWFTSMFSGKSEPGDVVTGGALNVTKITALLVPLGTAIAAFVESQTDAEGPLGGLTPGQKLTLWIAVFAFVLVVVVVDMIVRAVATAASLRSAATPLPIGMKAMYTEPEPDVKCLVAATRSFNGQVSSQDGEFLVVYGEAGKRVTKWVKGRYISFPEDD